MKDKLNIIDIEHVLTIYRDDGTFEIKVENGELRLRWLKEETLATVTLTSQESRAMIGLLILVHNSEREIKNDRL